VAERLYRSRDDRMLAGVAAGVAETLDADPSLVRIAWALLVIFTGGIAFLVYIVMAIVVPEAPAGYGTMASAAPPADQPGVASGAAPGSPNTFGSPSAGQPTTSYWTADREARRAARRARRDSGGPARGGVIAGAVLIVIGGVFLIREFVPWFDWHLWWPVGLIALGGLLLVVALLPGRSSE
jgi:phage shock protein C